MQSESGTKNEREGAGSRFCRSRRAEVSVMVDVARFLPAGGRGS